jgi:hypothetical protein
MPRQRTSRNNSNKELNMVLRVISITAGVAFAVLLLGADKKADQPTTQPASPALMAYEKFKGLEGTWEGKSSKGWTERVTYSVIAGGSCVLETSEMLHGKDEEAMKMATAYHMDGQNLMLTHYCAAKNQPRMRASEISADGGDVLFTFIDGTNMSSRDKGHMDKAHIKFVDADTIQAKWTWYADGKEQWMEEIEYRRVGK